MNGFSLLEIMIALSIIGILSVMCLPIYSEHITHANRLEAEVDLVKLANALEEYFIVHQSYKNATLEQLGISSQIVRGEYQLAITDATDFMYGIKAIPLGQQAQRDVVCASLIMDSLGKKDITGTGKLSDCWT